MVVLDTGLSSSFVGPETLAHDALIGGRKQETAGALDRKTVLGVYCVYMAIGAIGDFFVTFLAAPTICQYVFGPMGDMPGDHVTVGQCNVAPSVFQISWNFKLFFGFFLDIVPFFGSRRKGWIMFGWTGGMAMLAVTAVFVEHFAETHQFENYLLLLMGMCICYTFSDVAADGLVIELSKLEPESKKGYLLTTCQMLRFLMMMISTLFGTLVMSGPSYQPPGKPAPGALILPFELPLGYVHWMLFCIAMPFYIGMWVWIRDPPVAQRPEPICQEARSAASHVWTAMKSYAVFMLLVNCVGTNGFANMMNPANQGVASISKPTNIQTGIGSVLGNMCLTLGVWMFRRFFLNTNWRVTLVMTQAAIALCGAFSLMSIYDTWGISRNGWFYMLQNNLPALCQGLGRIVSSLAIIEISPKGLEATVYELLVSANNGAISLSVALQSVFAKPFQLDNISSVTWDEYPSMVPVYQKRLASATLFALAVNLTGALVFMWFLPRNAAHCREWASKKSWRTNWAACLNVVILFGPLIYANYTTLYFMAGS